MLKQKRAFVPVILLLLFASPRGFSAEDIVYVASGSMGFSSFDFPEKLDAPITHIMAEVAVTGIYKGFISTLSTSQAIDKADVSEEDETGQADRSDYDFLLGYQLSPNWILFGGYKKGETSIDFINRVTAVMNTDVYKQSGPYLGASYSYHLQRSGKLAFSAAYAYLDSDNTFHASTRDADDTDIEFDDLDGHYEGKTQGLSLVASLSLPLTPGLIYQARLRYNDYQQTINGTFEGQSFAFDVPEKHLMLMMGLSKVF
ncbi:MAG: hypothetical protein GQ549_02945 [Gammaproteobacteria bacterium]|nr:hypothetical protein [Gammaproteobacteria bacterium]